MSTCSICGATNTAYHCGKPMLDKPDLTPDVREALEWAIGQANAISAQHYSAALRSLLEARP